MAKKYYGVQIGPHWQGQNQYFKFKSWVALLEWGVSRQTENPDEDGYRTQVVTKDHGLQNAIKAAKKLKPEDNPQYIEVG